MVGETLGSYRIIGKIGEGGMGAVYQAEHALIGRRAAIKVLLPELSSRADVVRRFFNEARAIANLNHPAIIDIFDFGFHSDGSGYIVMELLEGESLGARLKRVGHLDGPVAVRLTRQIAAAMSMAHNHGVIHRDLKPDNLFLVPDRTGAPGEVIKILDFGVAKLASAGSTDGGPGVTSTGTVLGTPLYMAPEQCRGAGLVDARADIYALGCVAYHMLCGQPPFIYDFPGELIAAHLLETPRALRTLNPSVTPAVEEVVLRTLAKRPEDRPQSMQELLEQLDRATTAPNPVRDRRTILFGAQERAMPHPATPVIAAPTPAPFSAPTPVPATHTMVLPEEEPAYDEPPAPRSPVARVTVPRADTTLGRNLGEIASAPARPSRRYLVTGAVALATVGLGVVLLSGRSAKSPSQASEETQPAATVAPAPAAPVTPEPVAAAPVEAVAPPPVVPTPSPAPSAGRAGSSPTTAQPASVTFKIEGAREEIAVKVDGKSVPANAPIRLPRDGAIHTVRVSSAHFAPETFSKRADGNRTFHLKNELRLLTAPGN
ncbi:MAG: eukaryotic-like serine/threonine-protein kinase [Myxococcales bacterium]|jgi:serine/threonine-protein kinase|nr:eukaryotic-like serine/threonine-protein kinase [Myxococcales bacterium]